jgi:hypothetical protein
MAPHVNMHGGFNAQSVHPILAIRYRWRHATSKVSRPIRGGLGVKQALNFILD